VSAFPYESMMPSAEYIDGLASELDDALGEVLSSIIFGMIASAVMTVHAVRVQDDIRENMSHRTLDDELKNVLVKETMVRVHGLLEQKLNAKKGEEA